MVLVAVATTPRLRFAVAGGRATAPNEMLRSSVRSFVLVMMMTMSRVSAFASGRAICSRAPRTLDYRRSLPVRSLASMSAFRGPVQEMVEESIAAALEPTHMEVINTSHGRVEDESHFKVVCVSEKFEGKRLVMRHRMLNEAVADESGALPFHSLEIAVAKTPAQWAEDTEVRASPQCQGGDGRGMLN